MEIRFHEILELGTRYTISDISWVPEELLSKETFVEASLFLTKKSDNRIDLRGELTTKVALLCDFCLDTYFLPVNTSMRYILDCSSEENRRVHQVECTAADIDIVVLKEPVVDVGNILMEQLYLSLPLKKLCVKGCQGLCRTCGENLNKFRCKCPGTIKDSPFAVLETLKKD